MKKVFLYAYDKVNLGDDLFVHTICNRYSKVKFYLLSKKYNKLTYKNIKNLKVIDQDSMFLNFMNKLYPSLCSRYKAKLEKKCDAVVYVGGSIFIEYKNWKQILTWWDYEAANRHFYVLGANFGPYKTEAYRNELANILNNVEDVCFRDKFSFNLFNDVNKVRYAPDILFGYNFPDLKEKKQIFISVIDCASRDSGLDKIANNEDNYIALLLKYINDYAYNGYNVVLSSFCKIEKDEEAVDKLIKHINVKIRNQVKIINYDGTNIDELISTIAESELVIASRFHASILGFATNKPVLPVVYSDKTINILNDLNFEGLYFDIRTLTRFEVDNILKLDFEKQKLQNINAIKKESNGHFMKLDNLLLT